jgi:multidrug resistance efflux pump
MELEIFEALTAANVPAVKARQAAQSIERAIDRRYELHATQMATRGDIDTVRKEMAEMKTERIKAIAESQRWTITAIFAAVGLFAALSKFLH